MSSCSVRRRLRQLDCAAEVAIEERCDARRATRRLPDRESHDTSPRRGDSPHMTSRAEAVRRLVNDLSPRGLKDLSKARQLSPHLLSLETSVVASFGDDFQGLLKSLQKSDLVQLLENVEFDVNGCNGEFVDLQVASRADLAEALRALYLVRWEPGTPGEQLGAAGTVRIRWSGPGVAPGLRTPSLPSLQQPPPFVHPNTRAAPAPPTSQGVPTARPPLRQKAPTQSTPSNARANAHPVTAPVGTSSSQAPKTATGDEVDALIEATMLRFGPPPTSATISAAELARFSLPAPPLVPSSGAIHTPNSAQSGRFGAGASATSGRVAPSVGRSPSRWLLLALPTVAILAVSWKYYQGSTLSHPERSDHSPIVPRASHRDDIRAKAKTIRLEPGFQPHMRADSVTRSGGPEGPRINHPERVQDQRTLSSENGEETAEDRTKMVEEVSIVRGTFKAERRRVRRDTGPSVIGPSVIDEPVAVTRRDAQGEENQKCMDRCNETAEACVRRAPLRAGQNESGLPIETLIDRCRHAAAECMVPCISDRP